MEYNKTSVRSEISVNNIITLHRAEIIGTRDTVGEAHDFPELIYIASGEDKVLLDGVPQVIKKGEAMIYAPMTHHVGSIDNKEMTLYIISFDTLSPLPNRLYNKPLQLTKKQNRIISEIFSIGLELFTVMPHGSSERGMFFNADNNVASLQIVKNNLELLLLSLCEATQESDVPVDEKMLVVEFLNKNITQELTLESIAKGCSMSTSKLKRTFKGGVINYFNGLKVLRAKELIRNTDMNFTEISESLGFTSLHYFSRLFKAKTGMSPSEFKKYRYDKIKKP